MNKDEVANKLYKYSYDQLSSFGKRHVDEIHYKFFGKFGEVVDKQIPLLRENERMAKENESLRKENAELWMENEDLKLQIVEDEEQNLSDSILSEHRIQEKSN